MARMRLVDRLRRGRTNGQPPAPVSEPVTASAVEEHTPAIAAEAPTHETGEPAAAPANESDYERRARQETERFAEELEINDLPPIFHYWSHTYLRPMFQAFGFSRADELFANTIIARAEANPDRTVLTLSLGAGNCDTEVRVGQILRERGIDNWEITCTDLVPDMLERGRALAESEGLADHFSYAVVDVNEWNGDGARYDVIMANQFLHHVVELETLFAHVRDLLAPEGRFVTSDMIGRNGHQRWPEARKVVDRFWEELPYSYRYHRQLRRQEDTYLDWDCSQEGFEGIRSQDVLPCLIDVFGFETFIAWGNVIDPFVDRGFGWNFDAEHPFDRRFIDRVQETDEALIDAGEVTPTHLMAVMTADRSITPRVWRGRTPERCVRKP